MNGFGRCHQFRHPTHPFSHGYSGFGHRRHGASPHRSSSAALCIMLDLNGLAAGARCRGLLLSDGGLCRSQLPGKQLGRSDQPGHRYFYAAVFQYYAPSADLDCTHIGLGSAGFRFHLPVSERPIPPPAPVWAPADWLASSARLLRWAAEPKFGSGDFDALCPARRSEFFVRLVFAQNRLGQRRLYENQLIFLSAQ